MYIALKETVLRFIKYSSVDATLDLHSLPAIEFQRVLSTVDEMLLSACLKVVQRSAGRVIENGPAAHSLQPELPTQKYALQLWQFFDIIEIQKAPIMMTNRADYLVSLDDHCEQFKRYVSSSLLAQPDMQKYECGVTSSGRVFKKNRSPFYRIFPYLEQFLRRLRTFLPVWHRLSPAFSSTVWKRLSLC